MDFQNVKQMRVDGEFDVGGYKDMKAILKRRSITDPNIVDIFPKRKRNVS